MQGDQPAELRQSSFCELIQGGENLFYPLNFTKRGLIVMHTYGDFVTTMMAIVSIARFVFDIIKYKNEHKKK